MINSLRLPIYALTIFISAFLIFSLQPFFSKIILPLLGGTSSVWNTAMVFFQAVLLAGYTYAHLSSKYLKIKHQVILHLLLLILCMYFLPITLRENNLFPKSSPVSWQLMLMLGAIGGPYFVLSASAPLLQKWFSASNHAKSSNPYFLYAISNIGSMGSLLAYPFIIEPLMTVSLQSKFWSYGYYLLSGLIFLLSTYVWTSNSEELNSEDRMVISQADKFLWILYALIPSSLMLGITTLITTDLASVPLFWVIPLAIYLGTFIIAFSEKQLLTVERLGRLPFYILCLLMFLFMTSIKLPKFYLISFYLCSFFVLAQYCHSKLFDLKPNTKNLTIFYLYTSLGGVLGGIFNAILAPKFFTIPAELSITLSLIAILAVKKEHLLCVRQIFNIKIIKYLFVLIVSGTALVSGSPQLNMVYGFVILIFTILNLNNSLLLALNVTITLLFFPPLGWNLNQNLIFRERNYFGILSISEDYVIRRFVHGTTLHGAQPLKPEERLTPITYYHPMGPAGDVFRVMSSFHNPQQIAVLGLGVGSVACYKAPERSFDFYEIDPNVIKLAEDEKYFTYLKKCGSPYKTILGDARLEIAKQENKKYDLIFVDTFSSDNIPVHIMTKEAFKIYFDKLKDDGMIAMNISNRFLDLRPVLASIAKEIGAEIKIKVDRRDEAPGSNVPYHKSIYAVLSKSKNKIDLFSPSLEWRPYQGELQQYWSDDYVNIISAIKKIN